MAASYSTSRVGISENKSIAGDVFRRSSKARKSGPDEEPTDFQVQSEGGVVRIQPSAEDQGYVRRLQPPLAVPGYGHRISEDKQIGIDQIILAAEREQIVAWALRSCRLVRNRSHTLPTSRMAAIDEIASRTIRSAIFGPMPSGSSGKLEHEGRSEIQITGNETFFEEYWSFCAGTGVSSVLCNRGSIN